MHIKTTIRYHLMLVRMATIKKSQFSSFQFHCSVMTDLSTVTRPSWWPHMAWFSFIELDKAVVRVIRLTSFLLLWFQCVCPLMPSRNTYLGFSYLGHGVSLHGCSSKAQPLRLTLKEVIPPDLECGVAPLGPPVPAQPPLLGRGVVPPSRHP